MHGKKHPNAPWCSLWCLIPGIGCCVHCSKMEDWAAENRLDAIGEACTENNKKFAERGITMQFVHQAACFQGLVVEVNPLLSNGQQNPYWTGSQPNLKPAEQQAVVQMQLMNAGGNVDEEQFTNMFEQASGQFDEYNQAVDKVDAIAHDVALLELYSSINPIFSSFLLGSQKLLCAYAYRNAIEYDSSLVRARGDLASYQGNYMTEFTQEMYTVRSVTNQQMASQVTLGNSTNFRNACALPQPPPYDQSMVTQYEQVVSQNLVQESAVLKQPVQQQPIMMQQQQQPMMMQQQQQPMMMQQQQQPMMMQQQQPMMMQQQQPMMMQQQQQFGSTPVQSMPDMYQLMHR